MQSQCRQAELDSERSESHKLVGAFDGGATTSNGGVSLLAGADAMLGLAERLAACFTDYRVAKAVKHSLPDLLCQRIFGLGLGYEDLFDHDALHFDPALAAVIDKPGGALAGKSTLNRMEHAGKIGRDRHHKFDHDPEAIERLFVDLFLDALAQHRGASSSTSMPRMIPFTAKSKAGTSTAFTTVIATCRSTSSAAGICSQRS